MCHWVSALSLDVLLERGGAGGELGACGGAGGTDNALSTSLCSSKQIFSY